MKKTILIIWILFLLTSCYPNTEDTKKIEELEKQVQEINILETKISVLQKLINENSDKIDENSYLENDLDDLKSKVDDNYYYIDDLDWEIKSLKDFKDDYKYQIINNTNFRNNNN